MVPQPAQVPPQAKRSPFLRSPGEIRKDTYQHYTGLTHADTCIPSPPAHTPAQPQLGTASATFLHTCAPLCACSHVPMHTLLVTCLDAHRLCHTCQSVSDRGFHSCQASQVLCPECNMAPLRAADPHLQQLSDTWPLSGTLLPTVTHSCLHSVTLIQQGTLQQTWGTLGLTPSMTDTRSCSHTYSSPPCSPTASRTGQDTLSFHTHSPTHVHVHTHYHPNNFSPPHTNPAHSPVFRPEACG